MKEFLKKELYSFRAVAAILARWLLLAVPTGLVCGAVGTAFHLAVEQVTEWRAEHIWLLWLLPAAGLAIVCQELPVHNFRKPGRCNWHRMLHH